MAVLKTTQGKELQALVVAGKPVTEHFEQIKVQLNNQPEFLSLFSEPIIDARTGEIEWSASGSTAWDISGSEQSIKPYLALSDEERVQLTNRLSVIYDNAQTYITELKKTNPDMSEALDKALFIPDTENHLFSVDEAPVLAGWGYHKYGESASEKVLERLVNASKKNRTPQPKQTTAEPQDGNEEEGLSPFQTPEPASNVDTDSGRHPPSYRYRLINRRNPFFWVLWVLIALLFGLILWLFIKNCALGVPWSSKSFLNYCSYSTSQKDQNSKGLRVLDQQLENLKLELANKKQSCDAPEVAPDLNLPPVVESIENDELSETETKVIEHGGQIGAVNVVLRWQGLDDLDLYVKGPNCQISHSKKTGCNGGKLDIDMNYRGKTNTNAVESIVFDSGKGTPGNYNVTVVRPSDKPPEGPTQFTLELLVDGTTVEKKEAEIPNNRETLLSFELPFTIN